VDVVFCCSALKAPALSPSLKLRESPAQALRNVVSVSIAGKLLLTNSKRKLMNIFEKRGEETPE
jgi:hypothetical protein